MKFTVVLALATLVATISAHGDVVGVDHTSVVVDNAVNNALNNIDAHGLGENLNADVLSHIGSVGGDTREDGSDDSAFEGMDEDEGMDDDDDQEEGAEEDDDQDEDDE